MADYATTSERLGRHRDFYKLWLGQSVSLLGSQVTEVALPLLAVVVLRASAAEMGALGTARWLPFLLFSLWVGVWADRVRRLPILIGVDIGRAIVMGTIVTLAFAGWLNIPLLIALVFAFGAMTVVFDVAYYSFIPFVVPREHLIAANSRLQASASIAQVGGPMLGGLLVQLLTAPAALIVDAVSFLVSVLSLSTIRRREPRPAHDETKQTDLARIREGLAVTYRNPYLRALAGVAGSYNLFEQWILTLFVLYAVRQLGLSAGSIGVIFSAAAAGALVGSAAAVPAGRHFGVGPAVLWAVVLECAVMLAVPLVPAKSSATFPILLVAFGLNGIGTALSSVVAITVRQTVTPDRLLGRMNASYRFISYGTIPLGAFLGGLAGQAVGVRPALAIGAVTLLTTVLWILASPLPSLRSLEAAVGWSTADASPGDA